MTKYIPVIAIVMAVVVVGVLLSDREPERFLEITYQSLLTIFGVIIAFFFGIVIGRATKQSEMKLMASNEYDHPRQPSAQPPVFVIPQPQPMFQKEPAYYQPLGSAPKIASEDKPVTWGDL